MCSVQDHVIPPYEGVPSDESKCHVTEGCPDSFDFRRLGGRVPAFVISPWVAKGAVFQQPKGKVGGLIRECTALHCGTIAAGLQRVRESYPVVCRAALCIGPGLTDIGARPQPLLSAQADQFGNSSQFELSSIPATAKSLFNLRCAPTSTFSLATHFLIQI